MISVRWEKGGKKVKTRFNFIDPRAIMGVVVTLVILAVGVFTFSVVISEIDSGLSNKSSEIHLSLNNTTITADSLFNMVGIVLIIGTIMVVVSLVYNYVGDDRPKRKKSYKRKRVITEETHRKRIEAKRKPEIKRKELPMWENISEEKTKPKKPKKKSKTFEEWE